MVVIVVMLLVSFLAAQLTFAVRTEQQVAFNLKEQGRAAFLAQAGVNIALFRLLDRPQDVDMEEEYGTLLGGQPYRARLDFGAVDYTVVNESGKIDLNAGPARLMELFLEYHGVDPDQIAVITDSLADWRDNDDLHRINGAEQDYYMDLPEPYIPRNGKIEDPAEFFLVNGTGLLADKFRAEEVFTVHNTLKKVNFNSLSPAMLDFLVAGDGDRKSAYYEAQQVYGKLTAAMAQQIMGDERYGLLNLYLTYDEGSVRYYTVQAAGAAAASTDNHVAASSGEQADAAGAPALTITALVRLITNGYQVLAWQEQYQ